MKILNISVLLSQIVWKFLSKVSQIGGLATQPVDICLFNKTPVSNMFEDFTLCVDFGDIRRRFYVVGNIIGFETQDLITQYFG